MDKETFYHLMLEVREGIFENFQQHFNHEKITHLDLSDFKEFLKFDTQFLTNLMKALKETPLITSIDLSNNNISSKESLTLLAELLPHTSITHLSLAKNNIDDELACHFALALRKAHAKLEYLDLNYNYLELKANKIPTFIQGFKKTSVREINLKSSFQPLCTAQDPFAFIEELEELEELELKSLTWDPFPINLSNSSKVEKDEIDDVFIKNFAINPQYEMIQLSDSNEDPWDWEPDESDEPKEKHLKCS